MERIVIQQVSKKFSRRIADQRLLEKIAWLFSRGAHASAVTVLKDITYTVNAGEMLGVVGCNGVGKTTLLQIMAGIIKPTSGTVLINGNCVSLINLRVGLQDRLTATENIYLCSALFGVSSAQIKQRFASLIAFAELEGHEEAKVYTFSQGMRQRLAFAIAMYADPEILLLDEVFEVGDEHFRHKAASHIRSLLEKGVAVVLVSNELDIIEQQCSKVMWIEDGKVAKAGDARAVIAAYVASVAESGA